VVKELHCTKAQMVCGLIRRSLRVGQKITQVGREILAEVLITGVAVLSQTRSG
jgi:hypothetical protein